MKIININNQSAQPKYKQIVLSIEMAIAEKRLKREDKLPSVNKVSLEFSISRDTCHHQEPLQHHRCSGCHP